VRVVLDMTTSWTDPTRTVADIQRLFDEYLQ